MYELKCILMIFIPIVISYIIIMWIESKLFPRKAEIIIMTGQEVEFDINGDIKRIRRTK